MNNWDIENDVTTFTADYLENGGSYERCMRVLRSHHKLPEDKIVQIRKLMEDYIWLIDSEYTQYTKDINAILQGTHK